MREFNRLGQPHYQAHQTAYAITILVYDAVPIPVIKKFKQRRIDTLLDIDQDGLPDKALRKAEARSRFERELEKLLANQNAQSHPFKIPEVAKAIQDYLHRFDGILYTLHCYSVMSNHVHFLIDLQPQLTELEDGTWSQPEVPLDKVIGRIKGGSAFAANRVLGRKGDLWMPGYHDRYIRSDLHYGYTYDYFLLNPVKAGLVKEWRDHFGTWGHGLEVAQWK